MAFVVGSIIPGCEHPRHRSRFFARAAQLASELYPQTCRAFSARRLISVAWAERRRIAAPAAIVTGTAVAKPDGMIPRRRVRSSKFGAEWQDPITGRWIRSLGRGHQYAAAAQILRLLGHNCSEAAVKKAMAGRQERHYRRLLEEPPMFPEFGTTCPCEPFELTDLDDEE